MRRRSLAPSTSRFEKRQARRERSLSATLRAAGLDVVMRDKDLIIDQFKVQVEDDWPVDIWRTWLRLAIKHRNSADWPCLAWRDGTSWCFAIPLGALDWLTPGPPLRHYALLDISAFVSWIRGRT